MEILVTPIAIEPYSSDGNMSCGGLCERYDECEVLDCSKDCNFFTEHRV